MVQNVRLQRLRDFTVQKRDQDSDRSISTGIVGTGIVIEPDRIITCAHVVQAALGRSPKDAADEKVEVHFPRVEGREPLSLHAVVDRCFREHDDDIIALRLVDGTAPLGPDQLPKLGSADPSEGNSFRSYGYSPTGDRPATRAMGTIMGSVEPPEDKALLVDPIQLKSTDIDRGMSGSAVLDIKRNRVVGLVAERYYPKDLIKPDLAYAVDNRVLTYIPFQFPLSSGANPLQPAPEPKIDKAEARAAVAKSLGQSWNNAPPSLQEWTGRAQLLQDITSDWINQRLASPAWWDLAERERAAWPGSGLMSCWPTGQHKSPMASFGGDFMRGAAWTSSSMRLWPTSAAGGSIPEESLHPI